MPGSYSRDEPESEESSESSASEYSEEDERYQRSRQRDSRLMSSSSDRRPSLKKQHATSPVLSTRSVRDVLRRNPKTDTALDYISSSDNVDSDRTARAVVHDRPRHAYTNSSRSSRRPSVSTTASSGRTKATTVSSGSGLANVIVERNGRHVTYLSQRDREALEYARQQHDDRKLQDDVRAYQDSMRGAMLAPELTVDNMMEHERRGSGSRSHYSGHSRRASRSSSRKPEGTRIEIGGNVIHLDSGSIHVDSGSTMHVRHDQDGASTLVIDSVSGKQKRYSTGSQASGNRRDSRNYGSSDGGSKREETIQEDEVYVRQSNALSDEVSKLQI